MGFDPMPTNIPTNITRPQYKYNGKCNGLAKQIELQGKCSSYPCHPQPHWWHLGPFDIKVLKPPLGDEQNTYALFPDGYMDIEQRVRQINV